MLKDLYKHLRNTHLGTEKLVKSNEKITFSCFFIIFAKKFCDMGKDLTIEELVFDDKNFNKHTEQGMSLLEKSLQELGAGRSILVDKNYNIISGNGIAEAAGRVGIKKVRVIEVQGDELVAVRRTDMEDRKSVV